MKGHPLKPLRQWQGAVRIWAAGFLAMAAAGLLVSIVYVHTSAGLLPGGVATRFAGPETGAVARHSFGSLLQTTHTHLFTIAFLQLALGGLFLLSSAPEGLKHQAVLWSWLAMALDHAGMWLAFAAGPGWAWLVWAAGTALGLLLALQLAWCLADLARKGG